MGTKMKVVCGLLSLLLMLTTTDAYIKEGICSGSDLGTETVKESWSCDADGGASCELEETNCGCDGKSITTGGYSEFDSEGNELGVGEGWNCFSKCQEKRRRKGTQEKSSIESCPETPGVTKPSFPNPAVSIFNPFAGGVPKCFPFCRWKFSRR